MNTTRCLPNAAATLHVSMILLIAAWVVTAVPAVEAHPKALTQLQEITALIREDPDNELLYLRRGHLLRELQRWEEALEDFDRAQSHGPELIEVDLARGQLYLEAGEFQRAEIELGRYLESEPSQARGLLFLARSLVGQDRLPEAVAAYRRFIAVTERIKPDYFLEIARVEHHAGNSLDALETLSEGLSRHGSLTSLEELAVDIEIELGLSGRALERLTRLGSNSPRAEHWLYRGGLLLIDLGRLDEARASLEKALTGIRARPLARQRSTASRQLRQSLREALQSIDSAQHLETGIGASEGESP